MSRDLCCVRCKGPLGLCRDKECLHHIEHVKAENRDDRSLRLYSNPTAAFRTGLERRGR